VFMCGLIDFITQQIFSVTCMKQAVFDFIVYDSQKAVMCRFYIFFIIIIIIIILASGLAIPTKRKEMFRPTPQKMARLCYVTPVTGHKAYTGKEDCCCCYYYYYYYLYLYLYARHMVVHATYCAL
jgi:hypothetical protein